MMKFVNEKIRELQEMIRKRISLLEVQRDSNHHRIRLTGTDLTVKLRLIFLFLCK